MVVSVPGRDWLSVRLHPGTTGAGPGFFPCRKRSLRNGATAGTAHWLVLTAARSWVGDVMRVARVTLVDDVTAAGSNWR